MKIMHIVKKFLIKWPFSLRSMLIVASVLFIYNIPLEKGDAKENQTNIAAQEGEDFDESMRLTKCLDLESLKHGSSMNESRKHASKQAAQYFSRKFPTSFIAEYEKIDENCLSRPFRPHLISALQAHECTSNHNQTLTYLVKTYGILLVLNEIQDDFKELMRSLLFVLESQAIRQILFLDMNSKNKEKSIWRASRFLKKTRYARTVLKPVHSLGLIPDLKLMATASLLLVHGNYMAALASLTTRGVVYFSNSMVDFALENKFRWAVDDLRTTNLSIWSENRQFEELFKEMGKVKATCCDLAAFGVGDDRKIVCQNSRSFKKVRVNGQKSLVENGELSMNANCWVLSLGCGGKWSFEASLMVHTDCVIQVFDCTGNFIVPNELRNRVKIHNLCVGLQKEERIKYRSLAELIEIGAVSSYLPAGTAPALVKMDIEGWEHPILHELLDEIDKKNQAPEQLVVEIHSAVNKYAWIYYAQKISANHGLYRPTLVELFEKLKKFGYVMVHRADNTLCAGCTEITLIKERALPGIAQMSANKDE